MYVEIQGGSDLGVTEQSAYGFVITAGFYTARGETVAQSVKTDCGQMLLPAHIPEVNPV